MKCPHCRHGFFKLLRSKCPYCKLPLDPKKWTVQKQQGSRDDIYTNYAPPGMVANPHAPMTGAMSAPVCASTDGGSAGCDGGGGGDGGGC